MRVIRAIVDVMMKMIDRIDDFDWGMNANMRRKYWPKKNIVSIAIENHILLKDL